MSSVKSKTVWSDKSSNCISTADILINYTGAPVFFIYPLEINVFN
jgi:hypothetical protein